MAFTGIASYDPGAPPGYDIAESLSPVVAMIARVDTPLLDLLGTDPNPVFSTHFEWLDELLVPNRTNAAASAASGATSITVTTGEGQYFRAGDMLKVSNISTTASASYVRDEVILITAVSTDTLTVTRGYGSTTAAAIGNGDELQRISRAALEGDDSPGSASRLRTRRGNWTQIFTEDVLVSGTRQAVQNIGNVGNEHDHQLANRLKELLSELERACINSVAPAATMQGSSTVRRTMDGILAQITANAIDGSGFSTGITEAGLNLAFRTAWDNGASNIDLLLVHGYQKRAINSFIGSSDRWWTPNDVKFKDVIAVYESDYGPAKVMLNRNVPRDMVIGLDTNRVGVKVLSGRGFYEKPLAETGDFVKSQVIGEYTTEVRNGPDGAHFIISDIPFTT